MWIDIFLQSFHHDFPPEDGEQRWMREENDGRSEREQQEGGSEGRGSGGGCGLTVCSRIFSLGV